MMSPRGGVRACDGALPRRAGSRGGLAVCEYCLSDAVADSCTLVTSGQIT